MNQSQNSYSLKNFLWWSWFRQSTRSKTLHLGCLRVDTIDRKDKTHDKKIPLGKWKQTGEHFFLEEICKILEN